VSVRLSHFSAVIYSFTAMSSCHSGRCYGDPDDDEVDQGADRDDRAAFYAASSNRLRETMVPRSAGRRGPWGGALRRMTTTHIRPSREDESRYISVPGRYVPIGFARYVAPVIQPTDYEYYRIAGWRVAVPRSVPGERVKDLLYRIFYYGPQSAGYVRLGDTLVPAVLGPGDRMTLAGSAMEYEPYPVST